MPQKKSVLDGTGPLISTIKHDSVHHDPACSVSQEQVTPLTSYNLLPKNRKTIIVPGSPPVWAPQTLPVKIPADSGVYSNDPVRNMFPSCPLEPFFRALSVFCASSTFDLKSTHLISDRRNLRLLLSYVSGCRDSFRFDTEVIGDTVMFSVWIDRLQRYANGSPQAGYGMEFEKRFTKPLKCVEGSITHNRAISYTMGGINMVVRFEVDGCISSTRVTLGSGIGQLAGESTTPTGFKVVSRGLLAAEESIIELKTSSLARRNMGATKFMPQLWFSRTLVLIKGYHQGEGTFSEVVESNVEEKMREWEEGNREKLQRLVKVLQIIIGVLKGMEAKKCAVVLRKGQEDLEIYALDEGKYKFGVPADIRARWD